MRCIRRPASLRCGGTSRFLCGPPTPSLPPHLADASPDADTFALRSYLHAADGRGETVGEMKGGLRRDRSGMRNESESEDGKVIETLPTVFFSPFFIFYFFCLFTLEGCVCFRELAHMLELNPSQIATRLFVCHSHAVSSLLFYFFRITAM